MCIDMLIEEKTKLFENNINLIRYILNKRWSCYANDDDIFQDCCMACWRALDTYDDNYALSTWWTRAIDSTCMSIHRKATAAKRVATVVSLSAPTEPSGSLTVEDTVVGHTDVYADFTQEYISTLTPRQKFILGRRLQGDTQRVIADTLGLSQAVVSRELRYMKASAERWLNGEL